MHFLAALIGLMMIGIALREGFETIVLPRTSIQGMRLTRIFYKQGWSAWSKGSFKLPVERREGFLSAFGPLSLIGLLVLWAVFLVLGFGLLQWSQVNSFAPKSSLNLISAIYLSGTTVFTLGLGDIIPTQPFSRFVAVLEAGTGFGFLAIVIGYHPTLYQSFSRRETIISMLDTRASSPPSSAELLSRYAKTHDYASLEQFLKDWEVWGAELLESHLSYPVLAFYRSQHTGQSWVSALATIMDTCALIISGVCPGPLSQATHTFAIGRHAAVDLAIVFNVDPAQLSQPRLSDGDWNLLTAKLSGAGIELSTSDDMKAVLDDLRSQYEPHLNAMATRFLMPLPPWVYDIDNVDNWRSDPWKQGEMSHL